MNEPSGGGGPGDRRASARSRPAPQAGYPRDGRPGGYTTTQRAPIGIDINGGAYDEFNMIGVGYVIEQRTETRVSLRQTWTRPMYRCAHTVPARAVRQPRALQPGLPVDHEHARQQARRYCRSRWKPTSAATLEAMMSAGTLSSAQLVKAELYRIALANADGPAIQAVRDINPLAILEASLSDVKRALLRHSKTPLGPAGGHPGGRRRLDQRRGPANERRLDRAGEQPARAPTRRSSTSWRRRARSSSATRTRPSSVARSTELIDEGTTANCTQHDRVHRRATPPSAARCCCRPTPTSTSAGPRAARRQPCRRASRRWLSGWRPRPKRRR